MLSISQEGMMSPKVDLNLIKIFLAIYETGSVSGAAQQINFTKHFVLL